MATNQQEGNEPVIDIISRDDGSIPPIRVRGESTSGGSLLELRQVGAGAALKIKGDIHLDGDLLDGSGQSGTYERDFQFNVKDYGAVGDGTTDDKTAITAAITAADTAGGGIVFFPRGTYKIATGLSARSNIEFLGAGQGASIIRLADSSASTFIVYNGLRSNVSYRHLGFHGGTQSGATNSLLFDGTADFLVENCRFTSMKQAIWLDGTSGTCRRATIRHNHFDSVVDFAIRVKDGTPTDVLIEGNYCTDVTLGVTVGEASFARVNGERIIVRNNIVASVYDTGVMVAGSGNRDVLVEGNTIRSRLVGVFVGTGAKRTRVVGNDIASTLDFGVHVYDATQVHSETVVANNLIHDCAKSGVEVEGVQGVTIIGNLIERVGTDTGAADNQRGGIVFVAIGANNVAKTVVVGNVIRDDAGTPTMRYGIWYQATSTDTVVVGNSVANGIAANYGTFGTLTAPYHIQTDTGFTTSESQTFEVPNTASEPVMIVKHGGTETLRLRLSSSGAESVLALPSAKNLIVAGSGGGGLRVAAGGVLTIDGGVNVALDTTTGTKIGTATTQKIGFYNATPVVQPAANADTSGADLATLETEVNQLKATLRSLGLLAS